jgi:hypothetical protein
LSVSAAILAMCALRKTMRKLAMMQKTQMAVETPMASSQRSS